MWYDIVDKDGSFLGRALGDTVEGAIEGVVRFWPESVDRWLKVPPEGEGEEQKVLIPGKDGSAH